MIRFCLVLFVLAGTILVKFPRVVSASSSIVINELNYNPGSGNQNDEFIEVYNTTVSDIDLTGWCFTRGVSVCFPATTIIGAHDYVVVSPNSSRTLSTYNVTTVATYTGNLDNGGERLTLKDASANTVIDFTYDDSSPWPIAPDGNGPSLELRDPLYDPNIAEYWGASIGSPTPGVMNSVTSTDLPTLSQENSIATRQSTAAVQVLALVMNAAEVRLVYRLQFDTEQTIIMRDDGSSDDGVAENNIYGATIPAQAANTLVRYRIEAENISGLAQVPSTDDSQLYKGYVVNSTESSDLPLLQWYIDPADYEDMITNHTLDDQTFSCVIVLGDDLFDNASVRVKGQTSASWLPKKKFKIDLPSGYTVRPEGFQYPIKQFMLQSYLINFTDFQEALGWEAMHLAGLPSLQKTPLRVQKNTNTEANPFFGYYLLLEDYDKIWRQNNGYDTGALYKQFGDKKTRLDEDSSDIEDFEASLQSLSGDELKKYLYDNVDIASVINFNAVMHLTRNFDWSFYSNIFQYRDSEGTKRWSYLPWDLDNTFSMPMLVGYAGDPVDLDPVPRIVGIQDQTSRILEVAMFQFPEFQEMYYRRVRTLFDKIYEQDRSKAWFDALYILAPETLQDEYDTWHNQLVLTAQQRLGGFFASDPFIFPDDFPFPQYVNNPIEMVGMTPNNVRTLFLYGEDYFKREVMSSQQLPIEQSPQAEIKITELQYNPQTSQDDEYIELYNPGDEAVDLSSWTTTGVNLTFAAGSILPAHSYGVVVANDTQFRMTYGGGQLVLGQYNGHMDNNQGMLQLRRDDNSIAIEVSYDTTAPWPIASPSLALITPTADPGKPVCWVGVPYDSVTPGQSNSLNTEAYHDQLLACEPPQQTPHPTGSIANPTSSTSIRPRQSTKSSVSSVTSKSHDGEAAPATQISHSNLLNRQKTDSNFEDLSPAPNTSKRLSAALIGGIAVVGLILTWIIPEGVRYFTPAKRL